MCNNTHTHTHTVVMIGFERETYITTENNTITTEVCAIVTEDSPTLDREVEVQITSSDGSAEGNCSTMPVVNCSVYSIIDCYFANTNILYTITISSIT